MSAQAGGGSAPVTDEPTPGELLRQERERRAFSVQQAAEDLHLDVRMIEAIESNRFAALGAPVYAKGHLRKYAALLGLSPELVIERYAALSDTPDVPAPIPATVALAGQRERRSLQAPLWIVAAVLVVAAGWSLFNWLGEPHVQVPTPAASVTTSENPAARRVPTVDPAVDPGVVEDSTLAAAAGDAAAAMQPRIQPATMTTASAQAALEQTSVSAADTSSEASAAAAQVRLRLQFSAPCWTEVYDAAGRQLLFDLGAPGAQRTVTGVPPLRVTLGLASAVTAEVDDRPIIVPRRVGRDAARFTIAADGSVNPER